MSDLNDLKSALQYVVEIAAPTIFEVNGKQFSSGKLSYVDPRTPQPVPPIMTVSTLQGLVDFVSAEPEVQDQPLIVHIQSPSSVEVCSAIFGERAQRAVYVAASTVGDDYPFGNFIPLEQFVVAIQARFVQDEETAKILRVVGTMSHEAKTKIEDDGVTQRVEARVGVVKSAEVNLPNPVTLRPFRTFLEVEQPQSKFVLRIENAAVPRIALFEADGGAWKNEAISNIKDWLQERFDVEPQNVTVIG